MTIPSELPGMIVAIRTSDGTTFPAKARGRKQEYRFEAVTDPVFGPCIRAWPKKGPSAPTYIPATGVAWVLLYSGDAAGLAKLQQP
jgi:hypothetical protein